MSTYKGMKYRTVNKEHLHKYGISYTMIAKWFGYNSASSFTGSKAKAAMIRGINEVIEHIENHRE